MTAFHLNQRIDHPIHGVIFIGEHYIGIEFDDGPHALIRTDTLAGDLADAVEKIEENGAQSDMPHLPWPDSTFVSELAGTQHFLDSHWRPFSDTGPKEVFQNPVTRFGDVDGDLDILLTRRSWLGDSPPIVGQDNEGIL